VHSVKEQLFNYIVLCFIKLQILARISSFSLLRSQYNFCSGLRTWKFWQILLTLLNISVLISGYKLTFFFSFPYHLGIGLWCLTPLSTILQLSRGGQFYWWRKPTGTCFIQKIYAPSSSLLLNKEEEGAYIFEWNKCLWGNQSTRRKLPTLRTSHWKYLKKCCIDYTSPWTRFELATLVVIGTDYRGKSNYHTITTTLSYHLW
jgi:hypothetical protein